jgi:dTDP-4-amino-4,6-dideoxygalactose transaminase
VSALGVGPGDEVVTTPFTFAATSNAVLYRGGTPVFADVQADTKNVDPANVAKAVTKDTKAIIPVHYAGHPVDLDEIHAVARDHSLAVIEDAAHAVSAEYRGRKVGGLSDLSIFSFHPVKQMTTGEGGMVTTNDDDLAAKVRAFRAHGVVTDPETRFGKGGSYFYEMKHLGHRFYMTEMQAAIGVVQLGKLAEFQRRRREIVAFYDRELAAVDGISLPVTRPYVTHAWHLYAIELTAPWLEGRRDDVFAAMRAENIGVNVHYIPVHLHPYYRDTLGFRQGMFPVAERAYARTLTLPLFPRMADGDAEDVVRAVRKVLEGLRS